ncbi:MAG: hypothetical protein GC160_13165 [Acidobacteria bacterium]|nr:hypothetical protein [Acidobacteriota bacterium]
MAFADDLLQQARQLFKLDRRKPKQASLRRAVSTAYYALFHLLVSETVQNWKRPSERGALARMFDHARMKKACTRKRDELSGYLKQLPASDPGRLNVEHLQFVAATFIDMQQDRHTADYDNATTWTRTDVNEKIESVEEAFARWAVIRHEPAAQGFLVTLLIRDR